MTEKELRDFFKKKIPAAHKSLEEAAKMPEGEAKRYKVESALKRIDKGYELLECCGSDLNPKDILLLSHRLENVPIEYTANIFYPHNDNNKIRKVKAIIYKAIDRMSVQLKAQKATQQAEKERMREKMQERLKARQQRGIG